MELFTDEKFINTFEIILLTSEFSASPKPLLSEPLVTCGLTFITFECDCASSIRLLYVEPLVQMNLIIDEAKSKLCNAP